MSAPVVLLHGFGTSSARTWGSNGWLDLLAEAGREAIGIDLLGHGTAPKPHEPEAYADVERLVAEQMPAGPVDAVGFSMGARVLLGLAVQMPERFRRIVTLGVGRNVLRASRSEFLLDAIAGKGDPADPVVRYFSRLATHPEVDRAALEAFLRWPRPGLSPEMLGKVDCPVLVVIGERDFTGPADRLAEALPNGRLVVLPGVDHFATPKDFGAIDATLAFLAGPLEAGTGLA